MEIKSTIVSMKNNVVSDTSIVISFFLKAYLCCEDRKLTFEISPWFVTFKMLITCSSHFTDKVVIVTNCFNSITQHDSLELRMVV